GTTRAPNVATSRYALRLGAAKWHSAVGRNDSIIYVGQFSAMDLPWLPSATRQQAGIRPARHCVILSSSVIILALAPCGFGCLESYSKTNHYRSLLFG